MTGVGFQVIEALGFGLTEFAAQDKYKLSPSRKPLGLELRFDQRKNRRRVLPRFAELVDRIRRILPRIPTEAPRNRGQQAGLVKPIKPFVLGPVGLLQAEVFVVRCLSKRVGLGNLCAGKPVVDRNCVSFSRDTSRSLSLRPGAS